MSKSTAILVLGIPRSGTSLVAGILHRLGVDMGEGYLQPSDVNNPLGYYEDLRWQSLHKRITGIRYGTGEPGNIGEEQQRAYHELAQECNRKPVWGMKCPRLCFTAQWVWPYLQDCRIVAVRRDFEASVASLVQHSIVSYKGELRMGPDRARAILGVWRAAMDRRLTEFQGPVLEVWYKDVLKEPDAWIRSLARFAGVSPSNKQIRRCVEFVRMGMNHHG